MRGFLPMPATKMYIHFDHVKTNKPKLAEKKKRKSTVTRENTHS